MYNFFPLRDGAVFGRFVFYPLFYNIFTLGEGAVFGEVIFFLQFFSPLGYGAVFREFGIRLILKYIPTQNLLFREYSIKMWHVLGEHTEHPREQNWKPTNSKCSQRWILWSILTQVKPQIFRKLKTPKLKSRRKKLSRNFLKQTE